MNLYPVVDAIQEKESITTILILCSLRKVSMKQFCHYKTFKKNIGIAIFEKIYQYSVKINVGIRGLDTMSFVAFCIYS